ncbi:hypothetical protein K440DRAFT_664330 [Wilcoxina mikolae CBS 423.85]|nr:hypothetical protein K440DRAFT_664330 [Wilcoxina mikolae CBS 423.85]
MTAVQTQDVSKAYEASIFHFMTDSLSTCRPLLRVVYPSGLSRFPYVHQTKSSAQSTLFEDLGLRLDVERPEDIHDVRNRCFRELMTETEPEKVWFFFEKPILQARIIVQGVQCRIRQAGLVGPGQDTRELFWSFKSRPSRAKRRAVQSRSRGTFEPPSIGAFAFTFDL